MSEISLESISKPIPVSESKTIQWPPQYIIRRSPKAKRIFLQIHKTTGLEIVIPQRLKYFDIEQLLTEKRPWIEKNLSPISSTLRPDLLALDATNLVEIPKLPEKIEFKAIEETWHIFYHPQSIQTQIQSRTPNQTQNRNQKITLKVYDAHKMIWLIGNLAHPKFHEQAIKLLKRWFMQLAKKHLIPWLQLLSADTKLNFNHVKIRGQSTLWGSCNSKKNISLNYKLLFLPKLLTQHVLLHELCHIKHLNHSERFWSLLQTFDANTYQNKKILKGADDFLPKWLQNR